MHMVPLLALLIAASCAPAQATPPVVDAGVAAEVAVEVLAMPSVLAIVPRAAWDPTPASSGVRYPEPKKLARVYRTIVVHHSDFIDAPGPLVIERYHLEVSRFGDIGYHFVIAKDGTVFEGRSLDRVGAHAGATREAARGLGRDRDPDWGSIGVVLDGFFHDELPPPAQLAALRLLVEDLKRRFPKVDRVIGHREVRAGVVVRGLTPIGEPTVCPGERLFRWLDEGGLQARPAVASVR